VSIKDSISLLRPLNKIKNEKSSSNQEYTAILCPKQQNHSESSDASRTLAAAACKSGLSLSLRFHYLDTFKKMGSRKHSRVGEIKKLFSNG
jgi:hypothetical protein